MIGLAAFKLVYHYFDFKKI